MGIKSQCGMGVFQALQYKEDGKTCIVKVSITTPRNTDKEDSLTVTTDDIILMTGTPIVYHGLEK